MKKVIFTAASLEDGKEPEVDLGSIDNSKLVAKTTDKLMAGICHFAFIKNDGKMREAYGTMSSKYMPKLEPTQVTETKKKEQIPGVQWYWDLEANAIRSFVKDRLIILF